MNSAKLIFGTMPIGNLDDSTYRLIDHIKNVDLIAVENDEAINNIINHYGLSIIGKVVSISPKEFMQDGITNNRTGLVESREKIHNQIMEHISLNKTVLCLSDEGSAIVVDPFNEIRQLAISKGIPYGVLPGPSSVIESISYSKLYDGSGFSFYGMLFYNPNKLEIYKNIKESKQPSVIFYHHEIQGIFFKELSHFVGDDRQATLISNLTTPQEFILDGTISDIMEFVLNNDVRQPTLVIGGKS